jgi:hypothetical protein
MAAKTLKIDLVEEMVANYKNNQLNSILTNEEHPMEFDAQSVWFSLEKLKSFITTIEEEAASHPEFGLKNFGIRFYYTAYPKKELWSEHGYEDLVDMLTDPIAKDYEKLHTLIGIPTAEIKSVNQDFDPYDKDTYDGTKPASGLGLSIMAENHGSMIPPGSPVGTWF